MHQAIGLKSNKVYAEGSKIDCHRKILKDYPSFEDRGERQHGATATMTQTLPEPMIIRRK